MTDSIAKKRPQPRIARKKVYRTPVLTQYGDVRRLTGGTGGVGSDNAPSTAMTMPCWVAESLYGIDAPQVVLVRAWLLRCYERRVSWALFIVPLYSRFGQRVAATIRIFPAMKGMFRPVFERAVRLAYREYAAQAMARRKRV